MGQFLLLTIGALVVGAIGFGVAVLISGSDPGLQPVEPEGRAVPLPVDRPLVESDLARTRFDTAVRGYRMAQVDTALRRAAYDIGYKLELIGVLEAEVQALREGRLDDADKLRRTREAATRTTASGTGDAGSAADRADAEGRAGAVDRADAEGREQAEAADRSDATDPAGAADPAGTSAQPEEMRLP
ncbi:DivIVA domain-containing protein [Planosporangium sp. 12N6]|uniref:DivIVA domain-containing protein n=1 Tax=Planosporangium spinosum TaxID=3402278 RepID=UPI003CE89FCC